MREAVACCSTTATTLEKAYKSNIMALEWVAKVEEGREQQAFAETFWAVLQMCLPEAQGTFMYPLQLLTGDVPITAIMGMSTVALWRA